MSTAKKAGPIYSKRFRMYGDQPANTDASGMVHRSPFLHYLPGWEEVRNKVKSGQHIRVTITIEEKSK